MKQEFNIGLAILRTIMCFMVVLYHCWDASNAQGILMQVNIVKEYAVPVFMLMSFILAQNALVEHNKQRMIGRIERLLIPQFGWAIIYWIIYFLIDYLSQTESQLKLTDMLWQMFFGHSQKLNPTMWFQVDLIWLTLLFLIVILVFKNKYKYVLWILGIAALILQYSGMNMIFTEWRYEVRNTLGRFTEMLPIAVAGFIIASENILQRTKKHWLAAILTSIAVILFTINYHMFSDIPGYAYSGIGKSVVAIAFVVIFYVIPFDKLNENIKKVLIFFSRYTLGIYCMHRLIQRLLEKVTVHFNIGIEMKTFRTCIIIYIICFLCSWIGTLLFRKTKLKSLFN